MTMVISHMSSRNQLGRFLQKQGLTGTGVEVGTHRADFARILLENWPGRLVCIDPWDNPPGYESQASMLPNSGEGKNREEDCKVARQCLSVFGPRVLLLRETSPAAAQHFEDGELDFVYIDGDHRETAVTADLIAWWPRVRSGGVLAGHDFICPGEVGGGWGMEIQPAVLSFAEQKSLYIYLICEEGGLPWSFYFIKP